MVENIVTYTPGVVKTNSVRAAAVLVELDGQEAPWLEVMEINRCRGPRLNRAGLRLLPHVSGVQGRLENTAKLIQPGRRIRISMVCQSESVADNLMTWPLFAGIVVEGDGRMSGTNETVEIIATDELVLQNNTPIDGIRVRKGDDETAYVRSDEAVFNKDGRGNRTKEKVTVDGLDYWAFEPDSKNAREWTIAAAIRYIVSEHLGGNSISEVGIAFLEGQGQIVRDVDVWGLGPLTAIERLCDKAGLQFRVECVPGEDGEIEQVLQFYRQGQGREIYLHHQRAGEKLDMTQTNLIGSRINVKKAGTTIRVIGQGAVKRFESTFEMAEGWDQSLEINDYELYSPTTNEEFAEYQDVFRKWVLNEAGDYEGEPFNQGQAYNLSGLFGTENYAQKRRRFRPGLSRTTAGEPFGLLSGAIGYYLEISYNGSDTWQPYGGAFNVLTEECGIYLSGNQFEADVWVAICKDKLRFRITCAIDADEPLEVIARDGPIDCVRPVRTEVFDLGNEYKYQQVSSSSIFASDGFETGQADAVDDSERLRGYLREQLARLRREESAGSAELAFVRPDVWPGNVVKEISGRDLNLKQLTGPDEYAPQVQEVDIKLGNEWTTTICF